MTIGCSGTERHPARHHLERFLRIELTLRYGDRVEQVQLPSEWPRQVGAYLLDPEQAPSAVYARAGPSSLALLLPNAAAKYFDAPACRREP
jgi:hypothetical protein